MAIEIADEERWRFEKRRFLVLALGWDEREVSEPTQRAAAGVWADAGFFDGSPLPDEPRAVNWRMNSSSGLEVAAFSWMLMPAFSLRIRGPRAPRVQPMAPR